ncbi:hypothetical protein EMCG_09224 [[Emmonsia] crescens]|uniref:Uncharacterized protein n=1 Tax=[Emmonsia] crescens TaxID=73230 RepID=A0A0G2I2J9_9EURO|nr:hypothetical protein EMCG_09224 [Emmonsia crescens UAMH 3008]
MCSKAFYVHSCGHRSWGPLQRCENRYVCPPEHTLYYPIQVNNPCRFCRPRRRDSAASAAALFAATITRFNDGVDVDVHVDVHGGVLRASGISDSVWKVI